MFPMSYYKTRIEERKLNSMCCYFFLNTSEQLRFRYLFTIISFVVDPEASLH